MIYESNLSVVLCPMAGTMDNSSDGEDVEYMSDEEIMLREKNFLHYLDNDTVVKMGKTGVFWDAVGYPFPPGLSPDDIYLKIESAVCDCDEGEKSIWVYVDETKGPWGGDFLKNKTWTSGIYFLPGGDDKHKRLNRMLHDIHLWTMDFSVIRPRPSSLVLVSDQVKDDFYSFRLLQNLSWRRFRVFLAAQPNEYRPENEAKWPASLLDVVYSFKEKGDVSYSRPHRTKKQKPSSLSDCKDVEDLPRVEDFSTIVQGGQLGRFWRSAGKKNNDVFKKGEHLRSSPVAKTRDYQEMAVDLIIFATPTYEHPAILIVNPKPNPDSELHMVLKCLQSRNHHVLVVNPTGGDSGGGLFRGSAESVVTCIQGLDGEREPITKPECWC